MPLLYISGALNDAEQALCMLNAFYPRKRVSVSLRGCGKSESPSSGYSLDDHASDIEAAVKASGLAEYCLMVHSLGVPYAIRFAASHPGVKRPIIGDYPVIPESCAERMLERPYMAEKEHMVRGIQKESQQIDLYEELAVIKLPVLVIRGTLKDVMLKDDDLQRYKESLQQIEVTEIEGAGHEYWESSKGSFLKSTNAFLRKLDDTQIK